MFSFLVACLLSPVKGIEGGLPVFWHVDIDAAYMRCCLHINVKYEKLSVGFTVFHSHTSISWKRRGCEGVWWMRCNPHTGKLPQSFERPTHRAEMCILRIWEHEHLPTGQWYLLMALRSTFPWGTLRIH